MRLVLLATALLVLTTIGTASPPQKSAMAFEAATIKPVPTTDSLKLGGSCHGTDSNYAPAAPVVPPLGRCILRQLTLKELWTYAYSRSISSFRIDDVIRGGPSWASTDLFDVEAKAENTSVTNAELRLMLQTLMADRFKLRFHSETKEVPGYAVMVANNGPKLVKSKEPNGQRSTNVRPGEWTAKNATLAESLLRFLSIGTVVNEPVVDKTGIEGKYDFTLTFAQTPPGATALPDSAGPSFFTALQEQLGLRLEPNKQTIEIIVIDSVERPSEN